MTSRIPSLNPVYWPFLGPWAPFSRPSRGPSWFEKPGVAYLQVWEEEMRGRIAQSCPPRARFLPSWQHSSMVRGWVSVVLGWAQQMEKIARLPLSASDWLRMHSNGLTFPDRHFMENRLWLNMAIILSRINKCIKSLSNHQQAQNVLKFCTSMPNFSCALTLSMQNSV